LASISSGSFVAAEVPAALCCGLDELRRCRGEAATEAGAEDDVNTCEDEEEDEEDEEEEEEVGADVPVLASRPAGSSSWSAK
jgi:hypothetical protein